VRGSSYRPLRVFYQQASSDVPFPRPDGLVELVPVFGGGAAPLPLFTLPGKPILIALYAL